MPIGRYCIAYLHMGAGIVLMICLYIKWCIIDNYN